MKSARRSILKTRAWQILCGLNAFSSQNDFRL
jgi:hypothetical protein